jgi:hypothetical protein
MQVWLESFLTARSDPSRGREIVGIREDTEFRPLEIVVVGASFTAFGEI